MFWAEVRSWNTQTKAPRKHPNDFTSELKPEPSCCKFQFVTSIKKEITDTTQNI